ncbi:hypothetical protein LTR17_004551 [Elasticomyces elasticus]|nr:hypothetical protein LTR17_004551 [Elasticomyces elasticus]
MANGTASRAVSVASRSVTSRITPAFEVPVMGSASRATTMQDTNTASSGDTTLADEDVEMNGCTHNSSQGGAAEEDAMQVLGRHSRVLINAVRKLALLAIDTTLPSLPTFVVVGDQSAGKSSIVEAICDITVPRDQGTCTRCPFQITTSATTGEGEGWTCRVSLHHTHQYDSSYRAGADPTKYDYWRKMQGMTATEFETIRNKDRLQELLRLAQLAILHPGTDPKDFLFGTPPSDPGVGFSPNIVSIQIEGPDLPELSFFDLPGAIDVHADGENHLVHLVEKLIKSYLRDPKTLVLLACSADQDIENSTAFRYVGQCDALRRCTGVLTKPDLVGVKRFALLQRILSGEKFKLGSVNSWFVTKQLSQEELDERTTRHQARELEDAFFATAPWSTDLTPYASRFGTSKLQFVVSTQLTEHIRRELPDIMARIQARINTVNARLKALPSLPASASHTVADEARALTSTIETRIRGEGLNNQFRNNYREIMRHLREELRLRRPVVKLSTPGYEKPAFTVDSDDDATPVQSPDPTPSKKRKLQTPSKRTQQGSNSDRAKNEANALPAAALTFDLETLSEMYKRGSISDLPNQLNPKVTEDIIMQSQQSWNAVVEHTLETIKLHVSDMLRDSLDHSFIAKRNTTMFFAATQDTLVAFFTRLWDEEHARVARCVQCEQHKPLTYTYLSPQVESITKKMRHDRLTERVNEHYDTLDSKGYKVPFGDAERQKKRAELQESVLKIDDYDRIIGVVASALAYYNLAAGHLLDSIAKELQFGLLYAMESGMWSTLRTALHTTDEAHCAHLLAPDPAQEAQRVILQAEKERLLKALEEIKVLPQSTGF